MSRWTAEALRWPGRGPRRALWLSAQTLPGALPWAEFETWCQAHAGGALQVWVAARDLHSLDIDPALPLSDAQRPAYVRGVFAHYLGGVAHAAPLALWRSGAHHGACLAPALELDALRRLARLHHLRLRRVQPLWVLRLGQALQALPALRREAQAWVLALEGDSLVALKLARGQLRSLRLLRLDAPTPEALEDARLALGANKPCVVLGHGLAAEPEPARHPVWTVLGSLTEAQPRWDLPACSALDGSPDLLVHPMPRAQRLGWWAAVVASVLCVAAGADAWLAHAQRVQALARQQLAEERLALGRQRAAARDVAALPAAPAPTPPAALNHPWDLLLAGVEAGSGVGVHWLALEHAAERPAVRLQGQATSVPALLRMAERLSAQTGWRDVVPARLQPGTAVAAASEPAAAVTALAFEISAAFDPRGPSAGGPP